MTYVKCKIDGCDKPKDSFGMCKTHAMRVRRYGDPFIVKRPQKTYIDFVEVNGCFECTSLRRNQGGYPMIYRNKKSYIASRFVYEQCFGHFDDSLLVRHKCDNPSCINPEHLELGTIKDNMNDMVTRGRSLKGERSPHSKLTEENVREIRSMLLEGESLQRISAKFSTSIQNVCDIRARRSWKHVD